MQFRVRALPLPIRVAVEVQPVQDTSITLTICALNVVTVLLLSLDLRHTVTKPVTDLHLICDVTSLRDFVVRASCMNTCYRNVL